MAGPGTDVQSEEPGEATGGRLVPLPKRGSTEKLVEAILSSPTASVLDLLERTDHLLHQLEEDIANLREDQEKERRRIEEEYAERVASAEAAMEDLRALAYQARQIAEKKAHTDVLDQALARHVTLDTSMSFGTIVRRIEEELRLAKGITGAIRLKTIGDLLKQATLWVEHMNQQLERMRQSLLRGTEHELKSEGKEARASYEIGMSVVRRDLKALDLALPPSGLAWDDARWHHWEGWDPLTPSSRWIRIGTYFRPQLEKFRFPALLEFPGSRGFALDVGTGDREAAVQSARSIVVRMLASVPPGAVRFTLIDPVTLGESAAPLLPLGDFGPELVDGGVATLDEDIEEKLAALNRHIQTVIQQHLRGDFETLEQYNDAAHEVVEPYRVLVVFDYPNKLSDRARELVRNIIDNGPRCGVFTLLVTAPGAARANRAKWNALIAGLDVLQGSPDGFVYTNELSGRWLVDLDAPPSLALTGDDGELTLFGRLLVNAGEHHRVGARNRVSQQRAFELLAEVARLRTRDDLPDLRAPVDADDPATWWTGDSRRGIGVPLGRNGGRDVTTLWLDGAARPGALVGGELGSGVSTLLHGVISGLTMLYPPDELALYLVDLSSEGSAGFDVYAQAHLPHARVVASDAGRELALSVLDGLVREMTRRAMLFAPHGGERAGVSAYRDESGEQLPRILAVFDGFDRIFAVDDRLAERAGQLVEALLEQGAAYGIHLLAAVSSVAALAPLGRRAVEQLRMRIALASSDEDSRRLLGEANGSASSFGHAGEGVLTRFGAPEEEGQRFQACAIEDHELGVQLRDLRRLADEAGITRRPQVFEGGKPARLEDSAIRLLGSHPDMQPARLKPRLWLGEPLALGSTVEVTLRREPGNNLLVVAADERYGQGLLMSALASAALVHGRDLDVRVLDLMPLESGFGELVEVLGRALPVQRFRRRNAQVCLDGVVAELESRLRRQDYRARPLLLVIDGLGAGPVSTLESHVAGADTARTIERLVADGPEVGVHTVIWTDRLGSLARHISRATLAQIALRVVMKMSAEDSAMLIDSAQANTLDEHRALLYDEDAARLTGFRPYRLPSLELVTEIAAMAGSAHVDEELGRAVLEPGGGSTATMVRGSGDDLHTTPPTFSAR